jgi:hypothetical protein
LFHVVVVVVVVTICTKAEGKSYVRFAIGGDLVLGFTHV